MANDANRGPRSMPSVSITREAGRQARKKQNGRRDRDEPMREMRPKKMAGRRRWRGEMSVAFCNSQCCVLQQSFRFNFARDRVRPREAAFWPFLPCCSLRKAAF